jgi:DNA-binding winged helix-turn-helix (wHTH) protein/tetratricopeptide (TPR) repeat protein
MSTSIRFGRYCLHPTQGLTRGTLEVRVTPKSLLLLRTLAERPGEVVTKEELFRLVWPDTAVSDAALTSCIMELRQALRDDARRARYIETVHRRGFRFLPRPAADLPSPVQLGPQQWPSGVSGPFVGRDSALQQMSDAHARAREGVRQVVFVTGEAGIGKTSLVETFLAGIADRDSARICRADCVEHYGAGEAYQPLFDALTRLCRQPGGEYFVAALRRYAPTWLAQLPGLQTQTELRTLQRRTAGATPERMVRELTDALDAMSVHSPIVFWLEDLHWSDPSTLDWIAYFARRTERARVLLVATYRHEEVGDARRSPQGIAGDLGIKGLCTQIALAPLDETAVVEYVSRRFPAAPGADASLEQLARIASQHTDGNPLFLVNVFNDLFARGVLVCDERGWVIQEHVDAGSLGIPVDVRRTIDRQLDRLNKFERRLLEVASVVGSTFAGAAASAAADAAIERVEATLGALARRNAFVCEGQAVTWPDGTVSTAFHFLHALYREVLLARLSAGRRTVLHRLIGTRLEAAFGERASEIAAELAVHFEQARDAERAIVFFQRAAEADRHRGAHMGAQQHFQRALALLEDLPESPERDTREVILRIALGAELMATRGFGSPEVAACYAAARDLCERVETTPHLFPALWGLWLFYLFRGPLEAARDVAQRLLELAHQSGEQALILQAHHALWATAWSSGDLRMVHEHARAGMELYEPERDAALGVTYGNHDAGACAQCFTAWAEALAGRPATAARGLDAAIVHTRSLDHPFFLAVTLLAAAQVFTASRDSARAREHASEAGAIAREHGFGLLSAWASTHEGRALFDLGDVDHGLEMMRKGVAAVRATGSLLHLPFQLALLAEALLRDGLLDDSAESLREAFVICERIGERLSMSELHRVRGELRLALSDDVASRGDAEDDFRTAIDISRAPGAHLLTLRATVSLARLLAQTARSVEAVALLAAARADVIEGEDLPDVAEATGLLKGAIWALAPSARASSRSAEAPSNRRMP